MQTLNPSNELNPQLTARTRELFNERRQSLHSSVDRNFAVLMLCQWVAAFLLAVFVSPLTWSGSNGRIHPHVLLVLTFGGAITGLPAALALLRPGKALTRQMVAVCQMLMSVLLIHITNGRIETHFHVFGSLAFLSFYRDWRVLITASLVVAADHFLRGVYWPQSVFGTLAASPWRSAEHAAWVLFEDVFLLISICQNQVQMRDVAERQAQIEAVKDDIEQRTAELARENTARKRTEDALRESEQRFRQMAENIEQVVWMTDPHSDDFIYISPAYERIWGRTCTNLCDEPKSWLEAIVAEDRTAVLSARTRTAAGETFDHEYRITRPDGSQRWIRDRGFPVRDEAGQVVRVCGIAEDITESKQAGEELRNAEKQLRDASRQAGMAEVATSVLHNVGNVLNSVNTSIGLATEKVSQLKAAGLGRIAALLNEHAGNLPAFFMEHPQGVRLPKFLTQLAGHFATDQQTVLQELASLRTNLEHINEIVTMQQNYATSGGVIEILPLADVVEDALRMNSAAFQRHGTRVVREFDASLPAIPVDRNKMLLILVNLIRNAKYACDDTGRVDKCITLRTQLNGHGCAKISVSDNGIGIPPENLVRIFEHGFTTRKSGHGFGLHSSALAASEMGGSLRVHSSGHDCGATFTIELPLYSEKS
jgi:hypothetical protein